MPWVRGGVRSRALPSGRRGEGSGAVGGGGPAVLCSERVTLSGVEGSELRGGGVVLKDEAEAIVARTKITSRGLSHVLDGCLCRCVAGGAARPAWRGGWRREDVLGIFLSGCSSQV